MVMRTGTFPNSRLRAAIRQRALAQKCTLIVIDEEERNDENIRSEIDLVEWCAGKINIPVYLFHLSIGSAQLAKEKSSFGMMMPGTINASIVKAAGRQARTFEKFRNSCFADFGRLGDDLGTLIGDLQRSKLYQLLHAEGVNTLIITGRARASCVKGTSYHATQLGFNVLTASTVVYGGKADDETWINHANVDWYCATAGD